MRQANDKELAYMALCYHGAGLFSTCSKRQYYSIVLSADGRVVGTGYNGAPSGLEHCDRGGCPRALEGSPNGSSYDNCVALHAEQNALLWSDRTARVGGKLFVNGPPCYTCAKLIAGSGIKTLVYVPDSSYADWPKVRMMLSRAEIHLVEAPRVARVTGLDFRPESGHNVGSGSEVPVDLASGSREPGSVDPHDHHG